MKSSSALGGAFKINGPRHERGGVPLHGAEVEGGESIQYIGKKKIPYVFSDRLRVPGSRDTFANRHMDMKKGKQSTRDILKLMKVQETMNGPTREKMFLGGLVKGIGKVAKAALPVAAGVGLTALTGGAGAGIGASLTSGGLKGILGSALKYGPSAINIGRGLFSKDKTPEARLVDRSALSSIKSMNTTVNVDPQLQAVDRQTRTIMADPSASMAHKLLANAQGLNQTASIYAYKQNQESQLNNQKLSQIARMQGAYDMADHQAIMHNDDMRLRSDAARSNLIGTGLSQISGIYQQDQANKTALDIGLATATAHMDEGAREEFIRRVLGNGNAYGGFLKKKRKKSR